MAAAVDTEKENRLVRRVALDLNLAINASAKAHGPDVTGSVVAEALLCCLIARMKIARENGVTRDPWARRRTLTIKLFDYLAEAMGATD
jgi:hypothetical protein